MCAVSVLDWLKYPFVSLFLEYVPDMIIACLGKLLFKLVSNAQKCLKCCFPTLDVVICLFLF